MYMSKRLLNRPPQTIPVDAGMEEICRAAESVFGPKKKIIFGPHSKGRPASGKVRKLSRQRREQDGHWP